MLRLTTSQARYQRSHQTSYQQEHHLAWRTVKDLTRKNAISSVRLKGGSANRRLQNWTKHFQSLLGKEAKLLEDHTLPSVPVSERLNININPLTLNEFLTITKQLKSSKAFGPDNIPAFLWKDPHFSTLLLNLCNHTFSSLSLPNQIIPVPKKGELSLSANYRGISDVHCSQDLQQAHTQLSHPLC